MDWSYVHCLLIYWGCLLVKNSFVNISEVNRQCLHSLGTRSEDDFEKVSIFNIYGSVSAGRDFWPFCVIFFDALVSLQVTPVIN